MKYPHKFKHRHPTINHANPFTATGFISYKVLLRGEMYGEVYEYCKGEEIMLPEMLRMLVRSKNEVCEHVMALTDKEFTEHVRQSERRLRDSFY